MVAVDMSRSYGSCRHQLAIWFTGAQLRHNDFWIFADPSRIFTYNCDETFKTTSRANGKNVRTPIRSK